jgi:hypothetical protein
MSSVQGTSILFGDGLLGRAFTGLVRIPGFLANCTAVMMVGELSIRGLSAIVASVGFEPRNDSWISTFATQIDRWELRPFKNVDVKALAIDIVVLSFLGIIGTEGANLLGGAAPTIYNNVLTFLGPIRISHTSYITNVTQLLKAWNII